ncbi:interleukin 15, like isoform X2 [Stigmatopora argus]
MLCEGCKYYTPNSTHFKACPADTLKCFSEEVEVLLSEWEIQPKPRDLHEGLVFLAADQSRTGSDAGIERGEAGHVTATSRASQRKEVTSLPSETSRPSVQKEVTSFCTQAGRKRRRGPSQRREVVEKPEREATRREVERKEGDGLMGTFVCIVFAQGSRPCPPCELHPQKAIPQFLQQLLQTLQQAHNN